MYLINRVNNMKYNAENLNKLTKWNNSRKPELSLAINHPSGYTFYVVVDSTALPAYFDTALHFGKGGTRYTSDTDINEVEMLATRMTLKNAIPGKNGLYGGAKSGIRPPPHVRVKKGETPPANIISDFAISTWPLHIKSGHGTWGGPGCDMNFNESCIKTYIDTLLNAKMTGDYKIATGRPSAPPYNGAAYDINGAAGKGVAYMVKTVLDFIHDNKSRFPNIPYKESYNISIQGLGAMGKAVLKRLVDFGHNIVAVSDLILGGTIVNEKGLAYDVIIKALGSKNHRDLGKGSKLMPLDDIMYLDCDIFIPAAIGNVITMKNVSKVKAPLIVEAANFPITDEARTKLYEQGKLVIPGESANFGGSVAASVELDPNVKEGRVVEESLKRTDGFIRDHGIFLLDTFLSVGGFNSGVSPHLITNGISLERVIRAMVERGDKIPPDILHAVKD